MFKIVRIGLSAHCVAFGTGRAKQKQSVAMAVVPAGQRAELCPLKIPMLKSRPSVLWNVTVYLEIGSLKR